MKKKVVSAVSDFLVAERGRLIFRVEQKQALSSIDLALFFVANISWLGSRILSPRISPYWHGQHG